MSSALRRGCLLALACTVLVACRTPPSARPPADLALSADWPQRRLLLQQLRQFACSGRVAVSANGQGFNAQFNWQQMAGDAELSLRGPLGAGGLIVQSRAGELALQAADGRKFDGAAARAELERAIGAPLPIGALGYWLLGVPQPDVGVTETVAAAVAMQPAQLAALRQQDWQVDYQTHAGLPRQMTLTSGSTRVRLVIERWEWP